MAELRTLSVISSAVPGRAIVGPGLDLPVMGRRTLEPGSRVAVLIGAAGGVILGPVRDAAGEPIPDPDTGGGVTAHGALTGLSNDDHPQYVLHTELPPLPIIATGTVSISLSAQANNSAPITFPPGRFASPPHVLTNMAGQPGGSGTLVSRAISITTTGATVFLNTGSGAAVTATGVPVQWLAILEA